MLKRSPGHARPHRPIITRLMLVFAVLAALAVAVAATACGDDDDSGGTSNLKVGALLSLTGDWSTLGRASQAALQLAADDINKQSGMPKITLDIRDTKLDAKVAMDQLKDLASKGVKVVIGPQSSSEVAAIKDYAKQQGITIISQGSTSSTLSVGGDTVYRLAPDDKQETKAMAALLKADGITTIVPVWRADVGNQGLQASIRTAFEAVGGKATQGQEYPASGPDFAKVLDTVEAQVKQAQGTSGAKVAIYLAAFDEAADLFKAASSRSSLASLAWYGSDGVALSTALTKDATAAAFAQKVTYPNPIFGLDQSDAGKARWKPVFDAIKAKTNEDPDAFGLSAYDALELAAKAVKQAGGTDATKLGKALSDTAANSQGITGSLALNDAGDRAAGLFDFWIICNSGGTAKWVLNVSYNPAGQGSISKIGTCGQ